MTRQEIIQLRADRAKLIKEAAALLDKPKEEKRGLNAEEQEKFDKLHDGADEKLKVIEREERQLNANDSIEKRETAVAGNHDVDAEGENRSQSIPVEQRNLAYNAWMRYGINDMPSEQRQIMQRMYVEYRAQAAGTNNVGGYTVAQDTSMFGSIVQAMKQFGFDESLATVINSDTGGPLPIPTNDDTANLAAAVAENADSGAATDLLFGQVTLNAFMYSSGVLKASIAFLQDTSIDAESFVGESLGTRMGRKRGALLTTGAGTTEPKGIITASTVRVTTASSTAIAADELIDIEHSVDPAYRNGAVYMMHDTILKTIKKLKDSQGRYLWLPGLAVKEPDTINGYPYVINQHMDNAITTTKKTVLFGNLKKFAIRNVRSFATQRLVERYAEFGQVGFVGFGRFDSNLLDAAATGVLQQL